MTFAIKRGDRKPIYAAQLRTAAGPMNLAGCTIRFVMTPVGSTTAKVDALATIDDAAAGKLSYAWGLTDTDTAGDYNAEWKIVDGAGLPQTVPADGYSRIKIEKHPTDP